MSHVPDVIQLTQELIRIPSPSVQSNRELVETLERWLASVPGAVELERVEYTDARGVEKICLVARIGRGEGGLVFYSHTDTVPAASYDAAVDGGRVWGRGACDMKGPIACVFCALLGVAHLCRSLYWVLTADEEVGFTGAEHVVERSALYREVRSKRLPGVITEPTELAIVHGHKGCIVLRGVTLGEAAHSSTGRGRNANLAMIPFLYELKRIHDELVSSESWRDERFDPPVPGWNIVMSDGGTPPNVTAPYSEVQVSWRPMPGQPIQPVLDRVRAAANRCGVELEVRGLNHSPLFLAPDHPFVQAVVAAVRDLLEPKLGVVSYGTDGVVFGKYAPAVVLGPGSIEQAHRRDEWISVEQLQLGVRVYRRLIEQFCGPDAEQTASTEPTGPKARTEAPGEAE